MSAKVAECSGLISGCMPSENEKPRFRRYLHNQIHGSVTHSSQEVETTHMLTNKQNIHMLDGILISLQKEENSDI